MNVILQKLIREMIDELEDLDEFSVSGSIAGVTTPLGTDATYPGSKVKKKKKTTTETEQLT